MDSSIEKLEQKQAKLARWTALTKSAPEPNCVRLLDPSFDSRLARPPKFRGASVSAFADWIYELNGLPQHMKDLQRGLDAELRVRWSRIRVPSSPRWKLIHNGMNGVVRAGDGYHPKGAPQIFSISKLKLGGHSMSASPDLIFRRIESDDGSVAGDEAIAIVEIKCTDAEIPDGLWQNVRAQLWAYSKIDNFSEASCLHLSCEVWNSTGQTLRHTYSWRRDDARFDSECNRLFQAYAALAQPRL